MHHFFQFEAEHGEHLAQLFRRSRIGDKFLQPIETQQHMYFSSEVKDTHSGSAEKRLPPASGLCSSRPGAVRKKARRPFPGTPFLYAGN